ncbi:MAG: hypothetical protein KDI79_06640 [Anaerolineae bacterium]|nr:hypothetical protein [Anaerolineae bacterium]
MIGCVLIPYFAAAVERRADAGLSVAPLIINQPATVSDQVFSVSIEAARWGINPGLRLRQAQALCPGALFITANHTTYHQALTELATVLTAFTPKVEPANDPLAAAVYLDLHHFTPAEQLDLAEQIGQTVRLQTQFTPALGVATGKFPAYIAAASIGENRTLFVAPGQEQSFLAPLSIDILPLDRELARRLPLLGLRTVGQFARLPAGAVLNQFGSEGRWLHQLAQGLDTRPVQGLSSPLVEEMTHQFDDPIDDRLILERVLHAMAQELSERLQQMGRVCRMVKCRIELEDNRHLKEQLILRQPTNSSTRLKLNFITLLDRLETTCRVSALSVRLLDLIPETSRQLDLFTQPHQIEQAKRLTECLPQLVTRYGAHRFYEVVLTQSLSHLPERRFRLRPVSGR